MSNKHPVYISEILSRLQNMYTYVNTDWGWEELVQI